MKTHRVLILFFLSVFAASLRAEGPKKVLILGDSMMRVTAHATELQLGKREGVTAKSHTSLGSGLARLDVFDWMAKIDELVGEFKPDAVIVWFGTNDRQPITTGEKVAQPGTAEWNVEYARRIGEAMDKLSASGATVYWLELPDMRDAKMQDEILQLNQLFKSEAEKRKTVEFIPTRSVFSRKEGTFSPYVIGPNGMPLQVRDADGIHLNRAGADRMAAEMMKRLYSR